jgi:hypothetical protein
VAVLDRLIMQSTHHVYEATDVVARREETLDGQGNAHGVEHAVVGQDSDLSKRFRSGTTVHVGTTVGDLRVSVEHHAEEQDPNEDVPHVQLGPVLCLTKALKK